MPDVMECDLWLDELERRLGHSLCGVQERDGYSLVECVDMHEEGTSLDDAVREIQISKRNKRDATRLTEGRWRGGRLAGPSRGRD